MPGLLAGHHVGGLDLPALPLAVADVHPVEHGGPVHGLDAAGAALHLDDGVGAGRAAPESIAGTRAPRPARATSSAWAAASARVASSRASSASSCERAGVVEGPRRPGRSRRPTASSCAFSFSSPWAFWFSLQKPGSSERRGDLGDAGALPLDVKATPGAPPGGRRGRSRRSAVGDGHGGQVSWRSRRRGGGARQRPAPSRATDASAQAQAKISPNLV